MRYRVELETKARKELVSLPKEVVSLMVSVLDDLSANPRSPGTKKLMGNKGYRIRKGAYRILYTVDDSKKLVQIYRIGHRRDIYR